MYLAKIDLKYWTIKTNQPKIICNHLVRTYHPALDYIPVVHDSLSLCTQSHKIYIPTYMMHTIYLYIHNKKHKSTCDATTRVFFLYSFSLFYFVCCAYDVYYFVHALKWMWLYTTTTMSYIYTRKKGCQRLVVSSQSRRGHIKKHAQHLQRAALTSGYTSFI